MAEIIHAAACSLAAIKEAAARLTRGSTLVIPAGSSIEREPVTIEVPPDVHIQGQGNDTSILTDDIDRSGQDPGMLTIITPAEGFVRLSGVYWKGSGNQNARTWNGSVRIAGDTTNFRLDRNHIDPSLGVFGFLLIGEIFGVADQNKVELASTTWIKLYGKGNGDEAWAKPTDLGTNRFFFIENNDIFTVDGEGAVEDSYSGSRFVVRNNRIHNVATQTHPTGGSGRARGTRAFEIYGNQWTADRQRFNAFFLSSGSGVVHGNQVPAQFDNLVSIHSMRFNTATYTQAPVPHGWGQVKSAYDQEGSALDQPGKGKCDLLDGEFPNVRNVTKGVAVDQPGFTPEQETDPVHIWDNHYAGPRILVNYEPDVLKEGRDYVIGTPKPGYTPFAFPHPLIALTEGATPVPPDPPVPGPEPPIPPMPPDPIPPDTNGPPTVSMTFDPPLAANKIVTVKNQKILLRMTDDTGPIWTELWIKDVKVWEGDEIGQKSYTWNTAPYRNKGPVLIVARTKDAEGRTAEASETVTVRK